MMFKGAHTQGEINGFLDAGSHMKGELHFEDTFRIDGKLTGAVISQGDLIVGESGEVDGDIRVRTVFISGTLSGIINASGRVEITSKGKVRADVFTPTLCIEEGSFFEGRCAMEAEARPRPVERGKVRKMPIAQAQGAAKVS
jgi:cytoskeletal protein CcmA (bactofilin family)